MSSRNGKNGTVIVMCKSRKKITCFEFLLNILNSQSKVPSVQINETRGKIKKKETSREEERKKFFVKLGNTQDKGKGQDFPVFGKPQQTKSFTTSNDFYETTKGNSLKNQQHMVKENEKRFWSKRSCSSQRIVKPKFLNVII
jgi:hypothetical protein